MTSDSAFKNTFLTKLTSINIRSREFPHALTEVLASQESTNNVTALQGEDALTLVDILDQAFDAPNMELDLQRKSILILRRVCGAQTILPRSCVLSDNISKEGDTAFASGGFSDVWRGCHGGNRVCIKAFRAYTAENLSKMKQRLFQEIVTWRRLSHPNVLPVLGVSPKLFPVCVITEWMVDGNIMDFTSKRPEVNRLRLLAEAASGLDYLHSMDIVHGDLKPTNILIGRDFHPRITDYGLTRTMLGPNSLERGNTAYLSVGTVRYMAPELLSPSSFGLKDCNPTRKSDIYAFGVVTYQVITGQPPFPSAKDKAIAHNVITGGRPGRPPGTNEWLSDDVWNTISRCWSPSWDNRPDVDFVVGALNDAADVAEVERRKVYATTNDQETSNSRRMSGTSRGYRSRAVAKVEAQTIGLIRAGVLPPSRELSRRQVGDALTQQIFQRPPPASKIPETRSIPAIKTPAASKAARGREENGGSDCGMIPPVFIGRGQHLWTVESELFISPRPRERY